MGANFSTALISDELQQLKKEWENKSLQELIEQCNRDLNLLKNITLNITITGNSGAGKSSLVNVLRGMTDYEAGAAETGVTETTKEWKSYPHPTFPSVILWDLPGIGTRRFEPMQYLENVNFKTCDFFIIVSSERFTSNDVLLAREIKKMWKQFYYVRTKVDVDISNEQRKPDFSKEKCLEKIRKDCCDNLIQEGESNPRVFLISRWHLDMYDFSHLVETLENELDNLKRHALILALPAFSEEVPEKKKAALKPCIVKVALLSCSVGAIPVPGLAVTCDIGILVKTMINFCVVFGLDDASLCRYARWVGKPVDELRSAIRKSTIASKVTFEFVIAQLAKLSVCEILKKAKSVLPFVPVLNSLAGGFLSFASTYYILTTFLDDITEDAKNVQAKVLEPAQVKSQDTCGEQTEANGTGLSRSGQGT